jgi:pimeloyl-ACP methyl ester carboxylesterase
MPKVKVNDIEMYYEVHGEGTPLVLLHGFTSSSSIWKPFIQEYKKNYKLIIPDMRGHGYSTNPSNTFTHRQSAHDIYTLLDHLNIDQFKAIGYSSGGMTLLHMATQQPERINKMILIASQPYLTEEARKRLVIMGADNISPEMWEYYRGIHHLGDEQIILLRTLFRDMKDSYDDLNFTPPLLSTIKAQTLIVSGDRDQYYKMEIPLLMYNSIPESYLWVLPNVDHNGVLWPVPAFGVKELCFEFLSGKWEES